uniref:Reverse transcriptase domain-containing protein n=1 Tax=Tanacetum cinerariifolium TaxID=118510 RepID=A0A699GLS9_TANCI|nr:reverse transcriptase domain-containing protein [Tanacetum cinerariifolium]
MSKLAEHPQTPTNSVVWNTAGKGSKQSTDGNYVSLLEDQLLEICEKHYNRILPIMTEKVHQEKLRGVQTRLRYSESSRKKAQTKEKTQHFESESCDRKRKTKKWRSPSLDNGPRSTHPGRSPSVFSILRPEKRNPARQRSPVSITVFTRLGARDKNVFTRLGEKRGNIRSRLGPKVTSWPKHTSDRRRTDSEMPAEDQNHGRKETRNPDRGTLKPKIYAFLKASMMTGDIVESVDNYEMLRKAFLGNLSQQKKYIKDPVEIHHVKQKEGESTEAFMERFKAESMHVNGAPECMRISGFMHENLWIMIADIED